MKIATWNVNSIRARLPILLDWLAENEPDLAAIQELKAEDAAFPRRELEEAGWLIECHGQKTYNGVAFLTRRPMEGVVRGLPGRQEDARMIRGSLNGIDFINTYVPNGTEVGGEKWAYKLGWLERFEEWVREELDPKRPAVWLGDINIAPSPDDVYDSERMLGGVGHHPEEFSRLDAICDWGWADEFRLEHQEAGHYTFFDYRVPGSIERNLGWRIDHIYTSPGAAGLAERTWVDPEPRRRERPSDHHPVLALLRA